MPDHSSSRSPMVDPYEFLQITPNPDGTITRDPNRYAKTAPTPDPTNPTTSVLSKDINVNQSKTTSVRVFLPLSALRSSSTSSPGKKLPLIVYHHGGGFINCSATSTIFHEFCSNIAADVGAVVVSVDYRLAPEHRLPAAYDDSVEVLRWVNNTDEVWLRDYADYTNCYIMGSSAGANIAYTVGLRVSEIACVSDLESLTIRGLILHHPFIGGNRLTESELRMINDPHLPLCVSDLMWRLSLPERVDRDHEYCNPTAEGGSQHLENINRLGWRVLVTGCEGDPLIDRQIQMTKMMLHKGITVIERFSEGGYHVVELKDISRAKSLHVTLKGFISDTKNTVNPGQLDPYKHIHIVQNSDGTFTRTLQLPEVEATFDPNSPTNVLTKDISVNPANNTWVRIYLPRKAVDSPVTEKLPLVLYFHGGGFVLFSAASKLIHDYCCQIACELDVIVVSLEYRLAPEHRLPAAYDDAVETLHWTRTADEQWLREWADYGKCFLMGSSAGGNIAYQVGLRGATVDDLEPLKIKGLILQQPFFGGVKRTESEMRLANDALLPLTVTDLLWNLSLPVGTDRDHEFSNPTVGGGSKELDLIRSLEWAVMITGSDGDPLVDKQKEAAKLMKEKGIRIASHFDEGGSHGDHTEPHKAMAFLMSMKEFILAAVNE
ncbi:hypothetical protein K2173_008657 [Erythroxylum novogranatense]|uniref:Alpha/beta hydrolase fold-3 domain-containing protein n=1 Tax=Erythroxylum novogranatense TaxID=1862640 RepID=A0AAV8SL18_9ROSI|nr:hypothetical protein K2173_008657 [Erythroxylum novogranatense]